MALLLVILAPVFAALLSLAIRRHTPAAGRGALLLNAVGLGSSVWLCAVVLESQSPVLAGGGTWRADAFSALLALCISAVTLLASAFGPGLDGDASEDPVMVRKFRIYVNAFAGMMTLAVTANSVGLMWVTIEATTITSAVLIPLRRTKASVEASWKYLLICSVGIALAFAGTVLAYFDFVSTAGHLPDALNWTVLRATAPRLHPQLMQLAFAFILVGYGTKAGLAPMHTWLPDAHSEAPAPMSAMMSGVLLAVALYAVIRWKAVVDAASGPAFTDRLLIGAGLLSLGIGAFSLVIQRHYKRMLAYSSIEHVGLAAIGIGLGPLGAFAGILHLVNHAVAKSMAFLLAGRVLHRYKTSEIAHVSGLLKAMPWTGSLFAAGVLALVGLPPFGLFVSEFLLVRAAILAGRPWLAALILGFVLVAFVSLANHLNRMLYGDVPSGVITGERGGWRVLALTGCVAALVVLGLVLPAPLAALIQRSVSILVP